jgi:hypothetical protein
LSKYILAKHQASIYEKVRNHKCLECPFAASLGPNFREEREICAARDQAEEKTQKKAKVEKQINQNPLGHRFILYQDIKSLRMTSL